MSQTLIQGTQYKINNGKAKNNGTNFSIKKGKTKIQNTTYNINLQDVIIVEVIGYMDPNIAIGINGKTYYGGTYTFNEPISITFKTSLNFMFVIVEDGDLQGTELLNEQVLRPSYTWTPPQEFKHFQFMGGAQDETVYVWQGYASRVIHN